ncbi:HAMP domain-containing sensor histidine kinase [Mangrovivirga sp. M17]|uniref:histidine kinase n=1 Tax=Mangrovivirga halotolerans TaxID=2993936 RepID=A0ABT3RP15_9BACT|nr:HAMP domain-containing sensor histidine kinase [Mangrovivirga halotolerans]MCX2743537.1 HAMP domain-containing sensor histidine kinase [Mangrovivirga halotolerans]
MVLDTGLVEMRLIIKLTLIYLSITVCSFLVGGVIVYNAMESEIDIEQKRFLKERFENAKKGIQRYRPTEPFLRTKYAIYPLDTVIKEETISFSDTLVMHSQLQRLEPHLKLTGYYGLDTLAYKVVLYDVIIESDDIEDGVRSSMIKVFFLLSILTIIVSVISSNILLRPFYSTLKELQDFSLKKGETLNLPQTQTKELRELNSELYMLSEKIIKDYNSLKEFSENASHELQTPVAIARGKLDILLEKHGENMTEEQNALILSAQNALKSISKLSRSLGLLMRIDNKEYDKTSNIDLRNELINKINQFRELYELKQIELKQIDFDECNINADPSLIEILLMNLFQNSLKHNIRNGFVKISLDKCQLTIENSGREVEGDPEILFERFKKGDLSAESPGLGLAIVKKICDYYGFKIKYKFNKENFIHTISVNLV